MEELLERMETESHTQAADAPSPSRTVGTMETARLLKRSLQQVHRLCWSGALNATKVDGRWQVPLSEIEKRLKARGAAKKS